MVNFDDGNVVSAVQGWKAKHACEAARGRIMFAVIFWGDNYELHPNLTFFLFGPTLDLSIDSGCGGCTALESCQRIDAQGARTLDENVCEKQLQLVLKPHD